MKYKFKQKSSNVNPYLVVGVGGGACKAVMEMMDAKLPGAMFACIDSDAETIGVLAPVLGSSAIHWRRERAPARLRSLARVLLADTRLLIIVSTLGGYAGSTLAPYLARTACEMEIQVAGVLTMPLDSELVARHRTAQDGLWALRQLLQVHVVIDSKALLASGRFNNKPVDKFFDAARTEMSHAVADIAQQRQHLWSKLTSET